MLARVLQRLHTVRFFGAAMLLAVHLNCAMAGVILHSTELIVLPESGVATNEVAPEKKLSRMSKNHLRHVARWEKNMGKTRRWCDEQITEYVHPEGQETTVRDLPLLARVVRRRAPVVLVSRSERDGRLAEAA